MAHHKPIVEEIVLEHGPVELLGRFLLIADTHARQRGLTLTFGTLDELDAVNRKNSDTWLPLLPTFIPEVGGITDDNAICVFGRTPDGEVVATQCVRLFNLETKSFGDAIEDLTWFYADPERSRGPEESCVVRTQEAHRARGKVTISGAGWCRPDYRGGLATTIFPRVARAAALTRWAPDFLTAIMSDKVVAGGLPAKAGWARVHWDMLMNNSPIGSFRVGFFCMEPPEQLADLGSFIEAPEVALAAGRRLGRA